MKEGRTEERKEDEGRKNGRKKPLVPVFVKVVDE
jgi:hypothetical protein